MVVGNFLIGLEHGIVGRVLKIVLDEVKHLCRTPPRDLL